MRAHLDNLVTWKKDINSQVSNLAESIPRQQGKLLGRSEENPRNHQMAAMTLYYEGEKVVDEEEKKEEEKAAEFTYPVRHDADPGRDDLDVGRQEDSAVREVSPEAFFFLNLMYPGRYREGPVRDNYEPG